MEEFSGLSYANVLCGGLFCPVEQVFFTELASL